MGSGKQAALTALPPPCTLKKGLVQAYNEAWSFLHSFQYLQGFKFMVFNGIEQEKSQVLSVNILEHEDFTPSVKL